MSPAVCWQQPFDAEDAAVQLARFYVANGQPRAALAVVAGRADLLTPDPSRLELQGLLAQAAAQTGDFKLAINYEQARLENFADNEAAAARAGLAQLLFSDFREDTDNGYYGYLDENYDEDITARDDEDDDAERDAAFRQTRSEAALTQLTNAL